MSELTNQKFKKVILHAYYNHDGDYISFKCNPYHNKQYKDAYVTIKTEKRKICSFVFDVNIVKIETSKLFECEEIECDVLDVKIVDDTLIIDICQDWG